MYDIKSGEEKKEALLAQIDTDIGDLKTQRKKNVEEERELRIKRLALPKHLGKEHEKRVGKIHSTWFSPTRRVGHYSNKQLFK